MYQLLNTKQKVIKKIIYDATDYFARTKSKVNLSLNRVRMVNYVITEIRTIITMLQVSYVLPLEIMKQ